MVDRPLYAHDIAKRLGISVRAAQYRLRAWEARYGDALVVVVSAPGSKRPKRCVTEAGLRLAVGGSDGTSRRDAAALDGILRRLTALEDEHESFRRQIEAMSRQPYTGDF